MLVSLILSLMISDALFAYFLLAKRFYQSPKLRFAIFENQIRSLNNFFVFPTICVDGAPPHGWSCRAILLKSAPPLIFHAISPSCRAMPGLYFKSWTNVQKLPKRTSTPICNAARSKRSQILADLALALRACRPRWCTIMDVGDSLNRLEGGVLITTLFLDVGGLIV